MTAVRKESNAGVEDRFLSVPMAAKTLKKANATVLSLIVKGDLAGEVVAGRTVVTRESIEKYKARNPSEYEE